jgi:hypothetical protein
MWDVHNSPSDVVSTQTKKSYEVQIMLQKLQIYYQPVQTNPDFLESLTVSYYDFDEEHNTYRQKIVLEKDGVKYKIKHYLGSLNAIRSFIETLDITKYKSSDINSGDAYYYVKHGDKFLATSNLEDIRELLDWARFDEIREYSLDKYEKCEK